VTDSEFNGNAAAGLSIMVRSATAMPGTSIDLSVSETLFEDNMAYGLLIGSDGATLEADASLTDLEATENTGNGIGISVAKTIGNFTFTVKDVESWDNFGSGMHIVTSQESSGGVAYEGRVSIDMDSCRFHDNIGNGVTEEHHFAAAADEELRPLMRYELTVRNLTLDLNRGHGYYVGPLGTPAYGIRDANYEFLDSVFSDNDLAGLHIREGYNNNNLQGYTREMYNITNCTFDANIIGLEQYWNRYSYGTESSVRISECSFTGNDAKAIHAHGYMGAYSGESCLLAAEYEILDSLIEDQVMLDISGASDQDGLAYPTINVTVINNTYRSDLPMSIIMGGYSNSLKNPVSTNLLYRANEHEVSSAEDGLFVGMYGGAKLSGIVNIE
ncbi:MAG: right-handed parallel beta-helix repeat-containing protein, partial [Thermoplasmata archaeon]|nr:right-handed parallel beta-helix repeat-containing protein [Thermoplasmata archaeon]